MFVQRAFFYCTTLTYRFVVTVVKLSVLDAYFSFIYRYLIMLSGNASILVLSKRFHFRVIFCYFGFVEALLQFGASLQRCTDFRFVPPDHHQTVDDLRWTLKLFRVEFITFKARYLIVKITILVFVIFHCFDDYFEKFDEITLLKNTIWKE